MQGIEAVLLKHELMYYMFSCDLPVHTGADHKVFYSTFKNTQFGLCFPFRSISEVHWVICDDRQTLKQTQELWFTTPPTSCESPANTCQHGYPIKCLFLASSVLLFTMLHWTGTVHSPCLSLVSWEQLPKQQVDTSESALLANLG